MRRTKIGVAIFVAIVRLAVFGPLRGSVLAHGVRGAAVLAAAVQAWLGTDYLGHDVLTRVLYGGLHRHPARHRGDFIGIVLGVSLGLITGYARRWVDESIMRMLDVVLAFPRLSWRCSSCRFSDRGSG